MKTVNDILNRLQSNETGELASSKLLDIYRNFKKRLGDSNTISSVNNMGSKNSDAYSATIPDDEQLNAVVSTDINKQPDKKTDITNNLYNTNTNNNNTFNELTNSEELENIKPTNEDEDASNVRSVTQRVDDNIMDVDAANVAYKTTDDSVLFKNDNDINDQGEAVQQNVNYIDDVSLQNIDNKKQLFNNTTVANENTSTADNSIDNTKKNISTTNDSNKQDYNVFLKNNTSNDLKKSSFINTDNKSNVDNNTVVNNKFKNVDKTNNQRDANYSAKYNTLTDEVINTASTNNNFVEGTDVSNVYNVESSGNANSSYRNSINNDTSDTDLLINKAENYLAFNNTDNQGSAGSDYNAYYYKNTDEQNNDTFIVSSVSDNNNDKQYYANEKDSSVATATAKSGDTVANTVKNQMTQLTSVFNSIAQNTAAGAGGLGSNMGSQGDVARIGDVGKNKFYPQKNDQRQGMTDTYGGIRDPAYALRIRAWERIRGEIAYVTTT